MFTKLHGNQHAQKLIGLLVGIIFGFLLQKGGATKYDIIIGQLLFTDFTVLQIMLTAIAVGTLGIHALRGYGLVQTSPKSGSWGSTLVGALIFGLGFGLLGYCPGTVAGAAGQGSLDALAGGIVGMVIGAGIFANAYPQLQKSILRKGAFGRKTLPELLKVNEWVVIIPLVLGIIALLWWIETVTH